MQWFEVTVFADEREVDRLQVHGHDVLDAEVLAEEAVRDAGFLPEAYDVLTYRVKALEDEPNL